MSPCYWKWLKHCIGKCSGTPCSTNSSTQWNMICMWIIQGYYITYIYLSLELSLEINLVVIEGDGVPSCTKMGCRERFARLINDGNGVGVMTMSLPALLATVIVTVIVRLYWNTRMFSIIQFVTSPIRISAMTGCPRMNVKYLWNIFWDQKCLFKNIYTSFVNLM